MLRKERVKEGDKTSFTSIIKKSWPCFASYLTIAFTLAFLYINILIISNIIWPGEDFRSTEIGLLFGISTYIMAFSGLLFGNLADRISRIKLFSVCTFLFGLGFILNGFAPEGLGFITYSFFIICVIIRGFFSGGFWPVINSYITDSSLEDERSHFFGILNTLFQLFQLMGMILAAFMFQSGLWRYYFWIIGSAISMIGFFILRGEEPKRASKREELKDIMHDTNIFYNYRLNTESIKETIFKPTNLIAFGEGIFTTILLSVPDFLLVAYIQSSPYNFSPITSSLFMIVFGVPGTIIGSIVFAKLSDKLSRRNIKNRIYLIVFSLIGIFTTFMIVFLLPLQHFTVSQGNNLIIVLSFPIMWILGLVALAARSILGLYSINQPPLIQKINLPEAQGFISSTNQFLESIGYGTGPILAGFLLEIFNQNYQITVTLTMSIGIVGAFWWLIATKWIDRDAARISKILTERKDELNNKTKMN
ncbi:MAG: MFS transporter [Candidatus Lokiarchaeota archaeon]|nr:MFS transporter [Candidatus Lokiarchaeota archaeon]